MKKFAAIIVALAVLSFGAVAFAQMYGYGGGPGYGVRSAEDQVKYDKFFADTVDMRRQLHDLRFEMREAWLAGDDAAYDKLAAEFDQLRDELQKKADEAGVEVGPGRGFGRGFGPGNGRGCGGPGGVGGPGNGAGGPEYCDGGAAGGCPGPGGFGSR